MTETAKVWLEKAEGEYIVASREIKILHQPVHDIVCFHCHQCVEKYMKAVLIHHGIRPPYIHDLWTLHTLIVQHVKGWQAEQSELEDLTRLGVEMRYPSHVEPRDFSTREDAETCFSLCQKYRERLLALVK